MSGGYIFLLLLPFSLLVFPQTPDPSAAHIKEWTERHAHYLLEPKIKEADSWLGNYAQRPYPNEQDNLQVRNGTSTIATVPAVAKEK